MLMPSVFGKDLFDDFFDFPFYDDRDMDKLEKKLYGHRGKNLMKTDIQETGDSYIMEMDLPGFSKDDVKVSLKDGYLTIKASKVLTKKVKRKMQNTSVVSVTQANVSVAFMSAISAKVISKVSLSTAF